jgi:hypothetical protein
LDLQLQGLLFLDSFDLRELASNGIASDVTGAIQSQTSYGL